MFMSQVERNILNNFSIGTMTLAFDVEIHISFPIVDYVGVHVKTKECAKLIHRTKK